MKFEERLLTELRHIVEETPAPPMSLRRPSGTRRLVLSLGLAAAIATALAIMPSAGSRDGGGGQWIEAAYAVTENDDGTVTVEIRSIQDPEGLETKLEEAGVPAAVHYLPQDKSCAPPGWEERMRGDSTRMAREEAAMEAGPRARGAVRVSESDDGAFVFTIEKSKLEPDYTVVVFAEDDVPEHGQSAETVASIAAFVVKGDHYEECKLVDGSIEGWGFQAGAPTQIDKP